jgi:hypothetical protein
MSYVEGCCRTLAITDGSVPLDTAPGDHGIRNNGK